MKNKFYRTIEEQIVDDIKAIPKPKRTERQKKILKNFYSGNVLSCAGIFGGVVCTLGILTLYFGGCYSIGEKSRLKETYKQGLEEYKIQQIHELNEQFNDGKGFSTDEYKTRFDELNKNNTADYFKKVASQEAKIEYEQYNSDVKTILTTGASAAISGLALLGVGAAVSIAAEKKNDTLVLDELIARETKGKGKEL